MSLWLKRPYAKIKLVALALSGNKHLNRGEKAMSITTAVTKAKQVLDENSFVEPPVDVFEIARNNGVVIREEAFPEDLKNVSGFINIRQGQPVMYVNATDSSNRKKFTVAHELAHWILHQDEIRTDPEKAVLLRMAIGANTDPLEQEANAFAAELLVPMDYFQSVEDDKTVSELAELFQVSTEVIGYRKKSSEHVARSTQAQQD